MISVGGLGMEFLATPSTLGTLRQGQVGRVHTHLVVREDSLTLYGFADTAERHAFTVLLGIPKIGPKIALAALAVLTPDQLRQAVTAGDHSALTAIPGVGKKSAQRMILDIGDKLGPAGSLQSPVGGDAGGNDALVDALENLGWQRAKAAQALEAVAADGAQLDQAALLRSALQYLGAQRG